jgi:hypothetical protein
MNKYIIKELNALFVLYKVHLKYINTDYFIFYYTLDKRWNFIFLF